MPVGMGCVDEEYPAGILLIVALRKMVTRLTPHEALSSSIRIACRLSR
jgi:hypothetical protein